LPEPPVNHFSDKVAFIWSVADLLRGPYKPHQYGDVILPLTVLRRLDCVLAPTKDAVLARLGQLKDRPDAAVEAVLNRVAGQAFHNRSKLDFVRLKVGYEIPLTRHFYVYQPPRPLEQIKANIAAIE
jgi:type I restriction enzyme M protein